MRLRGDLARLSRGTPRPGGRGDRTGSHRRRPVGETSASVARLTGLALSRRATRTARISVLMAARAADAVREGPRGSAWFAHRGTARGVFTRDRDARHRIFANSRRGAAKRCSACRVALSPLPRVVVCEAAIDALSLAAIEQCRPDTLYAATAGGMGPATVAALQQILQDIPADPGAILIAATDADTAGRGCAARLESGWLRRP